MVVRIRSFDVLICAFNKSNLYFDFIGVIKDANSLSPEELDKKIENKFDHWIQYIFVDNQEHIIGTIKCKYMFIYPEDEGVCWIPWKKSNGEILPYPSSHSYMQLIYEYNEYGEVIKSYDKD